MRAGQATRPHCVSCIEETANAVNRVRGLSRFPCAIIPRWERWPSGLRRWSRKPVWDTSHRGFESHPLRHEPRVPIAGEVLEWPNRRDWKSRVPARGPWVRIPPSPPFTPSTARLGRIDGVRMGDGSQGAPKRDLVQNRVGANPPPVLAQLRSDAALSVLALCGVPTSLLERADGTALREAWRQFLHASVMPVSLSVASELSDKLDSNVSLSFDRCLRRPERAGASFPVHGRRRDGRCEGGGPGHSGMIRGLNARTSPSIIKYYLLRSRHLGIARIGKGAIAGEPTISAISLPNPMGLDRPLNHSGGSLHTPRRTTPASYHTHGLVFYAPSHGRKISPCGLSILEPCPARISPKAALPIMDRLTPYKPLDRVVDC